MPALLVNTHTAGILLSTLTLCDIDDHDAASYGLGNHLCHGTVWTTRRVPSPESLEH